MSAWAPSRNGAREAGGGAPSASALAASTPSRRPPLAISGRPGAASRASTSASTVGDAPVGERGGDVAGALVAAALDQRPVRAARARDVDRRHARVAQQRHVGGVHPEADLLDHTGSGARCADDRGDPGGDARELRLALGLDGLLDRVQVHGQAVGAEQVDQPRGALGASGSRTWAAPRLPSSSGGRSALR